MESFCPINWDLNTCETSKTVGELSADCGVSPLPRAILEAWLNYTQTAAELARLQGGKGIAEIKDPQVLGTWRQMYTVTLPVLRRLLVDSDPLVRTFYESLLGYKPLCLGITLSTRGALDGILKKTVPMIADRVRNSNGKVWTFVTARTSDPEGSARVLATASRREALTDGPDLLPFIPERPIVIVPSLGAAWKTWFEGDNPRAQGTMVSPSKKH